VNKWSERSKNIRETLDPRLQEIVDAILEYMDISLVYGHRGQAEQNRLYDEGKSKLRWPKSKHNSFPSKAVDIQPYPYPENEVELWAALGFMAGLAIRIADEHGIKLRWGGDWDMDGDVTDNNFDDLFHLEIVGE
jgi:peptidoglycan LD-endopeptidase CwlK